MILLLQFLQALVSGNDGIRLHRVTILIYVWLPAGVVRNEKPTLFVVGFRLPQIRERIRIISSRCIVQFLQSFILTIFTCSSIYENCSSSVVTILTCRRYKAQ